MTRKVRLAPGVRPEDIGPNGDPDWLLTRRDAQIVKLQRKVIVGRVVRGDRAFYVKRYNVFAWRVALGSLVVPSPASRAWEAAHALQARGFGVPEVMATVEVRTFGLLRRSFFVTRELAGACRADERWADILARRRDGARPGARRAFVRSLGDLVGRLDRKSVV